MLRIRVIDSCSPGGAEALQNHVRRRRVVPKLSLLSRSMACQASYFANEAYKLHHSGRCKCQMHWQVLALYLGQLAKAAF